MMARSDSTVQIPWLNLNCVSPHVLLSSADVEPVLEELSVTKSKKERGVRLNSQLSNITKMYAHYRDKQEAVPMTQQQAAETDKIVNDLSATLKTILCL